MTSNQSLTQQVSAPSIEGYLNVSPLTSNALIRQNLTVLLKRK
jgi:hypothetical protein